MRNFQPNTTHDESSNPESPRRPSLVHRRNGSQNFPPLSRDDLFGWFPSSVIFILLWKKIPDLPCLKQVEHINSRHLCGHLTAQRHGVRHVSAPRAASGYKCRLSKMSVWGLLHGGCPQMVGHNKLTIGWIPPSDMINWTVKWQFTQWFTSMVLWGITYSHISSSRYNLQTKCL